jgi:hypothetical protein
LNSKSISGSSSISSSSSNSYSLSSSPLNSISYSPLISASSSSSYTLSLSSSSSISPSPSSSANPSNTIVKTESLISTNTPTPTNSFVTSSNKPTISIPSKSEFHTQTSINTYSKANSPSPVRSVSNNYSNSYCISSTGILSDSCTIFSTITPTHSSSSSAPFLSTLVMGDLMSGNGSITMDSFTSFLGNRTSLDPSETTMIFNSISNLPASQIGDILKLAGVLTLNSNGGTFQYSSPSFNFKAAV